MLGYASFRAKGKMYGRQNVWRAKCMEGKLSEGKMYGGHNIWKAK